MDNTKRAIADEATEKEIPRAAYEGVLTIDVDAQVESMEEQMPEMEECVRKCFQTVNG